MKPRDRFSNRVADYVNYRPRYPESLIPLLVDRCNLTPAQFVADVGSGTGFLAELFLQNGNTVYAIEPNGPMRAAAEEIYGTEPGFLSRDGAAEATGLPNDSVHMVTAGQAFHWFEPDSAALEFRRILQPGGWVVLVWNERPADAGGFLAAYDALLHRHGTDYATVDHRRIDEARIASFFGRASVASARLENAQVLDREGLAGRVRSCSYVPSEGEPGHTAMMEDVNRLFDSHQHEGFVTMPYDTLVYMGQF